jgi:pantetheine-phosphate adenylyltransferase
MSRNVKGVYPGTFDPPTRGHLDIIGRALHVVDELIVGVATNAGKGPMFSLDERVSLIRQAIADMDGDAADRVRIQPFDNLLMHFTVSCGASVIVRGLRAVSDFEYEFQMAGMNAHLNPDVETVFLMASERTQFISSRLVKEICMLGGDVSEFVPAHVERHLLARVAEMRDRAS